MEKIDMRPQYASRSALSFSYFLTLEWKFFGKPSKWIYIYVLLEIVFLLVQKIGSFQCHFSRGCRDPGFFRYCKNYYDKSDRHWTTGAGIAIYIYKTARIWDETNKDALNLINLHQSIFWFDSRAYISKSADLPPANWSRMIFNF